MKTSEEGESGVGAHHQHAERRADSDGSGDEMHTGEEQRAVEKRGERAVGDEESGGVEEPDSGREGGEESAGEGVEGEGLLHESEEGERRGEGRRKGAKRD